MRKTAEMLGLGHEVWSDEVTRGWDSLGAPTIAMVAQQWREGCDATVQGEDPGHAETLSGTSGMSMAPSASDTDNYPDHIG
jgi:hypothetical protein